MKKTFVICGLPVVWLFALLWIVCGWVFGEQLIYSPVIYGDVVATNWQAIANASIETDDDGTFTNGSYTFHYRVWATNALGRTPYSTNLSVTFSGDSDYTNAVRLSWWRVPGVAGYVVEKSYDSGTTWTNWAPVSVGTTSMTDTATTTNVWPGIGSNVVTEIPDGSYPWLTSPLYVTQLEDVVVSTSPVYDTPLVADGSGNWIAGRVIARYISELFDFSTNAGITNGQTITWDGTNWVPHNLSSGSVQTNVIISVDGTQYTLTNNPTAGNDVLTFNQTDSTAGWTVNNFATGTPIYVESDAGITNHIITYDGTIYTVTNNASGGNDWLTFNSGDSTAGFTPNTAGSVQTNVIISVDGTQYTLTNDPTAGNDVLTFNQTDSTAGWTVNNFATGTPVYVESDAGITNEIISYNGARYTLTNDPSSGNDYLTFNSGDSTAGWTPNLSFCQGPLTGGVNAANNYIDGADYFRSTNGVTVTNASLGSFKVLPNTIRGYISGREYWDWLDNTNGVWGFGTNACNTNTAFILIDPVAGVLRLGTHDNTTYTRGSHTVRGSARFEGSVNISNGGNGLVVHGGAPANVIGLKVYANPAEYYSFYFKTNQNEGPYLYDSKNGKYPMYFSGDGAVGTASTNMTVDGTVTANGVKLSCQAWMNAHNPLRYVNDIRAAESVVGNDQWVKPDHTSYPDGVKVQYRDRDGNLVWGKSVEGMMEWNRVCIKQMWEMYQATTNYYEAKIEELEARVEILESPTH